MTREAEALGLAPLQLQEEEQKNQIRRPVSVYTSSKK